MATDPPRPVLLQVWPFICHAVQHLLFFLASLLASGPKKIKETFECPPSLLDVVNLFSDKV